MPTINQVAPDAKAVRQGDSSHWYSHTPEAGWFPLYAPEKNYTLREARKDAEAGRVAVPSVTTYFKVLNKQQLVTWQIEQALRVAAAAPYVSSVHALDDWLEQTAIKAESASRPAADLGTAIHAAIESAIAGEAYDAAMDVYVQGALNARAALGVKSIGVEVCCGSLSLGYGGKCDEFAEGMTVVDIKSRKSTGKTPKVASYSTDRMQLAAYGYARWGMDFLFGGRGIIIGISTSHPGVVTPHVFAGPALIEAFEAFLATAALWRFDNKYDPRKLPEPAAA